MFNYDLVIMSVHVVTLRFSTVAVRPKVDAHVFFASAAFLLEVAVAVEVVGVVAAVVGVLPPYG